MAVSNVTKILYAISSLANEGPTRVLLNTLRNIDKERFQASVVTFTPEKETSLIDDFRSTGAPIIQLVNSPGSNAAVSRRARAYRKLVLEENFAIVHAHCPRSLLFVAGLTPKEVKTVYTAHIYPETQYKIIHGRIKGRIIAALSNAAMRFIDQPVACSESVSQEFYEKKNLRIPAVNNGIEQIDIAALPGRDELLTNLGLRTQRKYLLFIGRLSAEKRISDLVETFRKLADPPVDLVVVGTGPEERNLRAFNSPHVHIMGFHRDVRPFLAACDYYISPSSTEGIANTLLEAMSVGMPSLLSEIPSHRFVLDKCEDFIGLIFDHADQASLATQIDCLQSLDTPTIRRSIQENFRKFFNAKAMTSGYETIYRQVIK